jgi:hypothetical protein
MACPHAQLKIILMPGVWAWHFCRISTDLNFVVLCRIVPSSCRFLVLCSQRRMVHGFWLSNRLIQWNPTINFWWGDNSFDFRIYHLISEWVFWLGEIAWFQDWFDFLIAAGWVQNYLLANERALSCSPNLVNESENFETRNPSGLFKISNSWE